MDQADDLERAGQRRQATDAELIDGYAAVGTSAAARRGRHAVGRRFTARFGGIDGWHRSPVGDRLAAPVVLRSYASWAVVAAGCAVEADYVVGAPTKWAAHVAQREPLARAELEAVAVELGFKPLEIRHMWAALAKLSVISGIPAGIIAHDAFTATRDDYLAAVTRRCGHLPKIFATPVFGLNAVMFHLGRAPAPKRRTRPGTRRPQWADLAGERPQLVRRCAVTLTSSPCPCGPVRWTRSTPP
jgi:hypothetical protein